MTPLHQTGHLFSSLLRKALALNIAVHFVTLPVLLFIFLKFPWLSLLYNLFFPFLGGHIDLSVALLPHLSTAARPEQRIHLRPPPASRTFPDPLAILSAHKNALLPNGHWAALAFLLFGNSLQRTRIARATLPRAHHTLAAPGHGVSFLKRRFLEFVPTPLHRSPLMDLIDGAKTYKEIDAPCSPGRF